MEKLLFAILLVLLAPISAYAYVPALSAPDGIVVADPLIMNVIFGELHDDPAVVRFSLPSGGNLSLSLLTPRVVNPEGKFDAVIVNESQGNIAGILEAGSLPWELYRDTALAEDFLKGPELAQVLPPGKYRIVVTSAGNTGKFALQIGSDNRFSLKDYFQLAQMGPTLKRDYFERSTFSFAYSLLGLVYIVCLLFIGGITGLLVRRTAYASLLWRKLWGKSAGTPLFQFFTALFAFVIFCLLLLLALFTSWNILLLLSGGFFLFLSAHGFVRIRNIMRAD